jgi:uncharacterized RDD family membrane protein YckC
MRWRDAKKRREREVLEERKIDNTIYAPFLSRVFALVMDMFLIIMPITFIVGIFFGYEALKNPELNPMAGNIQMILSLVVTVLFWFFVGQTPGKKAFKLRVVDSKTLKKANLFQLTIRYLGYFLSMITLIGFFIPLFRKDKRALHDLISRTAVIVSEEG